MPPRFALQAGPQPGGNDLVRRLLSKSLIGRRGPIETRTELAGSLAKDAAASFLAFQEQRREREERDAATAREADLATKLSAALGIPAPNVPAGPGPFRDGPIGPAGGPSRDGPIGPQIGRAQSLAAALLSDPSTRASGIQLAQKMLLQGPPDTTSTLTPEQEVAAFGRDVPGSFQRSSKGQISRIAGTEPATVEGPSAVGNLVVRGDSVDEELTRRNQQLAVARRAAGRSTASTTVNLPEAEKEAEKTFGKSAGERASKILAQADQGSETLSRLNLMTDLARQFTEQGGAFGAGSELKISTSKFLQAIGSDPERVGLPGDVGAGEALQAEAANLALGKIGGEGGLPANNFSEADRNFITQTVPRLEDTPEGFQIKVEIGRKVADRKVAAGEMFDDLRTQGVSIEEANRRIRKRFRKEPIFSADERKAIQSRIAEKSEKSEKRASNFSGMSVDELGKVDTSKLNETELDAFLEALRPDANL